jgi:hypothetical protein
MNMWPFFSFYGGKWRAAPRYPAPQHNRIFEPFAGAAGYSTRHYDRDIVLVERDPTIAAMWRYLIAATPADIRALPLVPLDGSGVDDLDCAPEAKSLIGFWLNKGTAAPCRTPSAWMRNGRRPKSFWGSEIRERIATQVECIKHWTVIEGDYRVAPDEIGTWFIDPPYQEAGNLYRFSAKKIDFDALGDWCQGRRGQVMVCENVGATWLPFEPFLVIKSTHGSRGKGQSKEALWQNGAAIVPISFHPVAFWALAA